MKLNPAFNESNPVSCCRRVQDREGVTVGDTDYLSLKDIR